MEKRLSYDVVIVGAGPSGASLGYFLAKEGVNVLILEKERLPRYKSCAGGVPAYLDKLLGFALDEVIEQKIRRVDFTYRSKDRAVLQGDKEILYTVMRGNFDYLLKEKAEEAGAEVLTGEKAVDVKINDNGAEVITDGHRFKGKIVVGADGLSSIVARKAGLQRVRRLLITVQGEVWVDEETLEDFQGRVILDIGYVPLGACWVFPKREHLTVGVAGLRLKNPQVYFDNFLKKVIPSYQKIETKRYAIPIWGKVTKLTNGRILLVGDAGSFANPLSGGGIYAGIWSSNVASRAIIDCLQRGRYDLREYENLVREEIAPELNTAYTLSKLVYPIPWIPFYLLLKRRFAKDLWEMEGDDVYRKLYKYLKQKIFSL